MNSLCGDRSTLYNLSPFGMDLYLESLTSYISRVAHVHNIDVSQLMNRIIFPEIDKTYLIRSGVFGGNRFYDAAKLINGCTGISVELVKVIEKLTFRSDLSNLTLNKWKDCISKRNLLKASFHWCPQCIFEWQSNAIVYYPLIWYLKVVTVCVKHSCFLVKQCESCKCEIDILRRKMIPGYCSNCFSSLSLGKEIVIKPSMHDLKWQIFVIKNIQDMLSAKENFFTNQNFKENIIIQLSFIKKQFFGNSMTDFSYHLQIPKSTIHGWLSSANLPSLENLLLICFRLDIKILDLLSTEKEKNIRVHIANDVTNVLKVRRVFNPLNLNLIEEQLNSLMTIDIPVSMSAAALKIGHDKRVLYTNFPHHCKKISNRYMNYIKIRANKRIEKLKEQIYRVFISLLNENIYPSRRRLEKELNHQGVLREKVLQEYWKSLLFENNIKNPGGILDDDSRRI
ncbi:TniQ family protein [Bacillus cereus]|uniref:TniQ family protein n=1 Tax=Bacillus cereus TaxID=1396 RepID=UPI001F249039|nr:TniQ family protein [Bacillus cereus]MCE7038198.1 TniQ family protein [Bacillus cereus]